MKGLCLRFSSKNWQNYICGILIGKCNRKYCTQPDLRDYVNDLGSTKWLLAAHSWNYPVHPLFLSAVFWWFVWYQEKVAAWIDWPLAKIKGYCFSKVKAQSLEKKISFLKQKRTGFWIIGMTVETLSGDSNGGRWVRGFGSLIRRKQVDSAHVRREGHQLARKLSVVDLVGIGNLKL